MTDEANKQFQLQQLFIKNQRFEPELTPYQLFQKQEDAKWAPKVDTELRADTKALENNKHEATLTLSLTGKTPKGQTIFQIKLEQAGVFLVENFEEEEAKLLLTGYALNQLYPYAISRINDMLVHGGFPPIMMAHVDFMQVQQQAKKSNKVTNRQTAEEMAQ